MNRDMDTAQFIEQLQSSSDYEGQIVHVREVASRPARYAETAEPLPDHVQAALKSRDIDRLYS
ncbi:MAG: hypothetical protein ACLFWB_14095, partial [Armatimonadota bacterium]